MKKKKLRFNLTFNVLAAVLIFIIDIPIPRGIPVWLLYLLPIYCGFRSGEKKQVLIITLLSSILLAAGQFLSPPGFQPDYMTYLGRIIGLLVLWIYSYNLINRINTDRKLNENFAELFKEKKLAEELSDFNMAILETSPYGVAVYEAEGNCTYANDAFCRIIGAARTQALAQNFHQILTWKESGLYELAMEALQTGVLQIKELHHISAFVKEVQAECKFIPFTVCGKQNLLLMMNDISDYKEIEKELIESKKQFSSIIDSAMDGIMVVDENHYILLFNKASEEMFQETESHALGESIERFIPERFHIPHRENIKKLEQEPSLHRMMGHHGYIIGIKSSGEEFPIEASVSQFEIGGKRYYSVVHRDITERKKAEDLLKESEERLRHALSAGKHGLYDFNIPMSMAIVDNAYESILEYNPGELQVTLDWWIDSIHPDDRNCSVSILTDCINGKTESYKMEYRMRSKSGTWKWILCQGKNLEYDESGKPIRMLGTHTDITDRKQAEEELRRERSKLQAILDNAPVLISMKDKNAKVVMANKKVFETFNIPSEDMFIGKSIFELFPKDTAQALWDNYLMAIEKGEPVTAEEKIQAADGNWHTYLTVKFPVYFLDSNELIGICAISTDITERKNIELALQRERELFEGIFNSIPVMITIYDPELQSFIFNEALHSITKWTLEDAAEGNFVEKVFPNPEERREVVEFMQSLKPGWKEFTLTDKDGRRIESSWSNIQLNSGMQIGIGIDLREIKKAERALRENHEKLIDAQKLAHIGSFETDLETQKVKWSEEIFNIYERDISEGEPSYEEAMTFNHPDDREWILEEVEKGTKSDQPFEFDYRIIVNEKTKYLHYIGKPVRDESGKVIKRTGAIMDITELKLAQIKMEELLKDSQRSNRDLEQFAYIASHDLQEPIRMIKSYSELLIKKHSQELDGKALEYLGFISEGSTRMQQLVSDLLKYSRISTQAKPFEKVDCNEILAEVLNDLRFLMQETKTEINFDKLPVINGDRTQIRQLFQNLIQNGIKFRNKGKPVIEVSCERKKKKWLFSVKDNGIGIEKENLERIFVIFQRLHTKEEYSGTGIGLAVVKKIIELHGGEIFVESEIGKGSVFYFTIPIR